MFNKWADEFDFNLSLKLLFCVDPPHVLLCGLETFNVSYYVRTLCGLTHLKEQLGLGCKSEM